MFDSIFRSVFDTTATVLISPGNFLLCVGASLLIGLFLCFMNTRKTGYSKSFAVTLATLPAVVCVVIMMVNGNIGAGVAVTGAFSLVRFRSAPGSAREIGAIFVAMGAGLICGMGYLGYALLFSLILGFVTVLYNHLPFGADSQPPLEKTLRITIPEDLNYTGVFDPILSKYSSHFSLMQVKTTNMGSLFKLTYNLTLTNAALEKTLIDELRCRNGNLEISVAHQESTAVGL